MGERKGKPGAAGVVVFMGVLFALLAGIPREIWLGVAVLTVLVLAFYAYRVLMPKPEERGQQRLNHLVSVDQPSADSGTSRRTEGVRRPPADVADLHLDSISSIARLGPLGAAASGGATTAQWIPAGRSVRVAGLTIQGGMLYVGTYLPTRAGGNDPCLIDPSKAVANVGDYRTRQMAYWPSYAEVSPSARRAYLLWLAGGRRDPEADIGFVFLFFYGLERRAIVDAARDGSARSDWPSIADEIRALLGVYGEGSKSFRSYATGLLDWVSLAEQSNKMYESSVPAFPMCRDLPLYVRLALGQAAKDGVPLPCHLARTWATSDPGISLRTPARRCAPQFETLFEREYHKRFGAGMVLPRNRTQLKFVYRPASAGFAGYDELKLAFKGIPDVSILAEPRRQLQDVVDAATKPLETLSRAVGKDPEALSALDGFLHLPVPTWPATSQAALRDLKQRLELGMVSITLGGLLRQLGAGASLSRSQGIAFARALQDSGIGTEPDMLRAAKTPRADELVVLFAELQDQIPDLTGAAYGAAELTLQLGSAVAVGDGNFSPEEYDHLRGMINSWTHLSQGQKRRLDAHLLLLKQGPNALPAMRRRFEQLDPDAKHTLAVYMSTVVRADGVVSSEEEKFLRKTYKALGVPFRDAAIEAVDIDLGDGPPAPSVESTPWTVALAPAGVPATSSSRTEAITDEPEREVPQGSQADGLLATNVAPPAQPDTPQITSPDPDHPSSAMRPSNPRLPALDADKVAELLRQSHEIARKIGIVLAEAEMESVAMAAPADLAVAEVEANLGLPGLDTVHASLARLLLTRPTWSRLELVDVAADMGVMLDGALETLNEAALDKYDIPFFDGDDPVIVTQELVQLLLGEA